jgi:WD40 repeat protein
MDNRTEPTPQTPTVLFTPDVGATLLAPPTAEPASDELPSVPGFELLGVLGRGGMGVVYRARELALGRVVALKMILSGAHASDEERRRFRVEAEAIAAFAHAGIIKVHAVGEHEGKPYLSLEFCPGGNLCGRLKGPMPPVEAARLVEQLARAVDVAHKAGIIHRDLKPANVLFAEDGSPRITDFGLARRSDDVGKTRTGALLGTPAYMAPEQARGERHQVGPASDIWALGVILYECLTGRPPFNSVDAVDTIMQVLAEEPVPPSRLQARLPIDLETIVLKCLDKAPEKRYASAGALADDLAAFIDGKPIMARPVGPIERLWKWALRRPAIAALSAACVVLFVVGFALVTWGYLEASAARDWAREEEARAKEALEQAKQSLYVNRIVLAEREWAGHNPERAREVLEQCPPERRRWEWGYLRWLCQGGLYTLHGHTDRVIALAVSGKSLASAGFDGTIRLWSAHERSAGYVRAAGLPKVHALAFSPDGKRLAAACQDGRVRIYEVNNARRPLVIQAHKGAAGDVAFHPDGKMLTTAGDDGVVRLWDELGGPAGELKGHGGAVSRLAFHPTQPRLASAGFDGLVIVWGLLKKEQLYRCEGHAGPVLGLDYSPDGKELASSGEDNTVRIWSGDGKLDMTVRGHRNYVNTVRYSPDGKRLVTASHDRTVRVWERRTGRELLALSGHEVAVHSAIFNGDGRRIFSAGADKLVKGWDALREPTAVAITDGVGPVTSVAIASDARTCASLAADGKVRVRDLKSGKYLGTLAAPGPAMVRLAGAPDGTLVLASLSRSVCLWRKGWERPREMGTHGGVVVAVAVSADGKFAASLSADEECAIWDARDGVKVKRWRAHEDIPTAAAFNPATGNLLTAGKDGKLKLWAADTWELLAEKQLPDCEALGFAFSPDGKRLAVCRSDGMIWLGGAALEGEFEAVRGHQGAALAAAFSADGKRLLTAGDDGAIKLWLPSGQEVLPLRGHEGPVRCVAFSPDGTLVVSGGDDETLRVWPTEAR